MYGTIFRITLLFISALALGGCVSRVSGHRLDELQAPIKKLNYVVLPGKFEISGPDAERYSPERMNANLHDLLPWISQRIPLVFSLNGIETGEINNVQYELIIKPDSATHYLRGSSSFIETFFSACIIDKSSASKKIWEGNVTFLNGPITQINEKTIDDFVKDILMQLAADGVVKLGSDEIKVPAGARL